MGIRMTTTASELNAFLSEALSIYKGYLLKALAKLGEECTVRIRNRSAKESWIDHTGNLRSSIGYAAYNTGKKFLESTFPQVLNGIEGSSKAKTMIADLAKEYSKVYALVVIAGMEYASNVEDINGKDVLASTEIWAKSTFENRLKNAIDNALLQINKLKI